MYILKAFRLLGNRLVVVRLVLELQHENHVALQIISSFQHLNNVLGKLLYLVLLDTCLSNLTSSS